MENDMPERIGTQGWKQFLSNKKDILNKFERAKEYAKIHEVETYHGIVAEEEFRNWLTNFLPKKYAVTSGYVISQTQPDHIKAPHFDVIIYDALNSPVLWTEDHSGISPSGKSQAIPAEHVLAVFEVKSQLSSGTANKAIEHLKDLKPLYEKVDSPDVLNKRFLPAGFICGVIFFELNKKNEHSKAALNNLIRIDMPRGYMGGVILRGEDLTEEKTASIEILRSESCSNSTVGKEKESIITGSPISDSIDFGDFFISTMVTWGESNFSQFAFKLLALLNGTYKPGFLSSMHGMSWMNPERHKSK
jgi:hypothetical protein